jgi:hypothetical protein
MVAGRVPADKMIPKFFCDKKFIFFVIKKLISSRYPAARSGTTVAPAKMPLSLPAHVPSASAFSFS